MRLLEILSESCGVGALLWSTLWLGTPVIAAAPQLLRTPGYESPVRADPDDLLMIPGSGFQPTDQVVYQAKDVAKSRPRVVPAENTAEAGTAPVVQLSTPPYAITVRLPAELQRGRAYELWVVTAKNEWSAPVTINDPRPQWITPSYVYSTADFAGFGRVIRVVGRNLARAAQIKLRGPETYVIPAVALADKASPLPDYVASAALPLRLAPGQYSISVRRAGLEWVEIPDQKLEVRTDPAILPTFTLADPAFGSCRPNDSADDSPCFARALEAAGKAGGGVVLIPAGTWDLSIADRSAQPDGFVVPRDVQLQGKGADSSVIVRHGALTTHYPEALLTLTGHNSVVGIGFSDDAHFEALPQSRSMIQLGPVVDTAESAGGRSHLLEDIIISDNAFRHVGRAITNEGGRPIARLFIMRNEFGAYSEAIQLPGNSTTVTESYRIDDSVVRDNRFLPGSYLDLSAHQGTLATGIGAGHHVDFSRNVADGRSTAYLQEPDDPPGFRAAFFWNLNNNVELTLVSENQISCSGDKAGDGEALSFDSSGDKYGFNGAPTVSAAGADWITVRGDLVTRTEGGQAIPDRFYEGHWIQIVDGPGLGQTRRVRSYTVDAASGTVTFHVQPAWDVVPVREAGRVVVSRQYWQVFVVANDIEHRSPPCRKSNLTGPYGGQINFWAPSADVVLEGNRQRDSSGILFAQSHTARTPSCPTCGSGTFVQSALEIRGNRVEGEYDWSSDCSEGGIRGTFGASPTPESPPPIVGFGISISHNVVSHSDGPRGGGIDIARTSYPGPPPGHWPFIENLLIFHNIVQDMTGPPPLTGCRRFGQRERSGIRIEGDQNIRDSVLYRNSCERVDKPLADAGMRTLKLCRAAAAGSCECPDGQ